MRVIQFLDALDFGDGVSNDVINLHKILDELKIENYIYSKWVNEKVAHYRKDIETYVPQKKDLIIYHFSGKSFILNEVINFKPKKIVRYHNVTPPEFFKGNNPEAYNNCLEGLQQIKDNINKFDGGLVVSPFNKQDLVAYGADAEKIEVLPIALNLERIDDIKINVELQKKLKETPYFLYVGRVAPNKCIEDILYAFENYYRYHNKEVKMYFVGNKDCGGKYTEKVMAILDYLSSKENIVFTGKVDEADLYTYYRQASAFICMSEHEGFCIPLLEAMYCEVPVLAYDSCAIKDTMGESGVLFHDKTPALVSEVLIEIQTNKDLRKRILMKQEKNIELYKKKEIKRKILEFIEKWEKCNE